MSSSHQMHSLCSLMSVQKNRNPCIFQRAVPAALRGTEVWSCHFQHVIIAARCAATHCLFVDLCQTMVVCRYDTINIR